MVSQRIPNPYVVTSLMLDFNALLPEGSNVMSSNCWYFCLLFLPAEIFSRISESFNETMIIHDGIPRFLAIAHWKWFLNCWLDFFFSKCLISPHPSLCLTEPFESIHLCSIQSWYYPLLQRTCSTRRIFQSSVFQRSTTFQFFCFPSTNLFEMKSSE